MKQIKNINIKLSKNTIILLVLLLILIFCYLEYSKKSLEGYLLPNCTINQNIDGPKTNDFQSDSGSSSISFKCKSGMKPIFYYNNSLGDVSSQYFIDISHNTSGDCANAASDISYDFYVSNNNSTCVYYDLSQSVYNNTYNPDVSTLLYVSCSGDVGPKFYTKLGKGEFSQSGFIKIKDTNFNYLAYANNACAIDYSLQNTQNNLQTCLDTANSNPDITKSLQDISTCFSTYGNTIINYVSGDYGLLNNGQFYNNEPKYSITSSNMSISDSPYINNYYTSVENNSLKDIIYEKILNNDVINISGGLLYSDNSLNYDNILNKENETDLEYKSTYLRNFFVIIVLILTIILLLISVINPDIISVEILTVYVLFILLLIFFGSKYFNIFESDVSSWKYSLNNWFQRNILNN